MSPGEFTAVAERYPRAVYDGEERAILITRDSFRDQSPYSRASIEDRFDASSTVSDLISETATAMGENIERILMEHRTVQREGVKS